MKGSKPENVFNRIKSYLESKIDGEAKLSEIAIVGLILVFGLASAVIVESDFGFFAVFVYFFAGYIFYDGFVKWRELRLIVNTPTSKIRSMPMGNVELKGTAKPGGEEIMLKSPYSKENCLFYKYKVEEYRSDDDGGHWTTIDSGEDSVRFVLEDSTDEVIVDPSGADIEIPEDTFVNIDDSDDLDERTKQFFQEKGLGDGKGIIFTKDRRIKEWYIPPGEDIYLYGYASKERDDYGEYAVIKEDDRAEMFMISDKSESQLIGDKKTMSRLFMFGGAFITLLTYAYMTNALGQLPV